MKNTITLLLVLLLYGQAFCKQIDEATAKKVGQNFLANKTNSALFKSGVSLELAQAVTSKAGNDLAKTGPIPYFYIFNISNGDGFVMVSGDDNAIPVLAYSDETDFDLTNIAPNARKWMEGYKDQIRFIIEKNARQNKDIAKEWNELLTGSSSGSSLNKKSGVSPLVQTKWSQSPYYNALCPMDQQANERTITGCVATAMAQVMKYWNYPASGTGFHSYNHTRYGTLSASFSSSSYNWNAMPVKVTSPNSAVATLMYDLGISVNMNYDIGSRGGSGAYVISDASPVENCSEYALKTYFGYKQDLKGVLRNNYSESQWISLLKTELDAKRPILYAGFGSGGGHAFICDGYDNNNFFHFNWGWGGSYDGFFSVNALNPDGVGEGGGTGEFNSNHQAIIGVQPASGGGGGGTDPVYTLEVNADVTPSATNIGYGQPFTISTNIINNGTSTFLGTYSAAVFDQAGVFVEFVGSLEETNGLPAGYTYKNELVFSSPGTFKILPGKNYKVYVFYKPLGGNWQQALASGSSIDDNATVNFINAGIIEMNSVMVSSPANFVNGMSASINLNIANRGANTFTGSYQLNLYNLDGSFVESLGTINETNGLPAGYTYSSPFLTFSTNKLDVKPGTYLVALLYNESGNANWYIAGSTDYQNPIKINITEAPLSPDVYETNNTFAQAYNLPLSFANNKATRTTIGSNCHTGTDYDYYKFTLPTGYNYKIKARIHDAYNAGNGQTYSIDGLLSYSVDGANWSDAFDDIIPGEISANGGTTIYFLVSPYFSGETGTYLFDASVTRVPLAAAGKEITSFNVLGMVGTADINSSNATVNIIVHPTTDVTNLTPAISVSNFAGVSPASGVPNNFANPVQYTVTAQDNSTKVWTITVTKQNQTGINENELSNQISVFPNPANELLNIDLNDFAGKVQSISLFNFQGQQVLTNNGIQNQKVINMNVSQLPGGIYLLQVNTDKGIVNKKIAIE